MKARPTQGFTPPPEIIVFQWDALFVRPNDAFRERAYGWSRLVLMWLAVFVISGLSSVSGEVKSLDGTIKFDSNFDGAPEAVLNSTGLGIGTASPSTNLHVAGNALMSGTMVVGGTNSASGSNLHISGTMGYSVQTVTGNTTLSGNSLVLVDSSAGNITLTLPIASTVNGRMYTVKKTSNSNSVFLNSISGLVLDLAAGANGYPCVQVMSDGVNWHVMGQMTNGISYYQYLIIDVSSGPNATNYPVTVANLSTADLTGAGNLQYKTDKIVLRYIPSGNFTMGSPGTETGRYANDEAQRSVTLAQGFYIGVFELTQQQFKNVMVSFPSSQDFASNTMPVHRVSYSDIRGDGSSGAAYNYPNSGSAVDPAKFMGLLRSKTGLSFDLPTETQWEYACRAGTTGALNSGNVNVLSTGANINDPSLKTLAWYDWNANTGAEAGGVIGTREVGAKLPNSWGLFDMHGNVWEWTLDWLGNPVGGSSGSSRVFRGGSYGNTATMCRSATRNGWLQTSRYSTLGFRLALPADR